MLYDIGFAIFSIFYLPTLIFKGKLHGDFAERFANYGANKKKALAAAKDAIWIQAVSVGEVALCKSFIPLLKNKFPHNSIVLSTITKTGNDLAKKLYPDDVTIIYFPLDFSFIVKKAVELIRPKIYIMIETEIWPNMLKEMAGRSIPSILINGRISDRSINKYKLARPFLKKTLERISLFCMQSNTDVERVILLGAPKNKVRATGSMKFDIKVTADTAKAEGMRQLLGLSENDTLFVAGSTHHGEEEIVIEVFKELKKTYDRLNLVIAPRHVDRYSEIAALVRQNGLNAVQFSKIGVTQSASDKTGVVILDAIGHLNQVYSIATIVFVGGSLVKHGGQNPIEPAIFEKPVLFGPYMFNFKNIAQAFLENEAAIQVNDAIDLRDKAELLLSNDQQRIAFGKNAKEVVLQNRGATERNLKAIAEII